MPLVDLLKNSSWVLIPLDSVVGTSLFGVRQDDLIEEQLADDLGVDGILLELEVVIVHWRTILHCLVVLRVI